jgi:hypothetical protein
MTHNKTRFRFAIGDAGRGLQASLAHKGAVDDLSAINLALEEGVSAIEEDGRGYGVRDMTDGLVAIGGNIAITSGTGFHIESPTGPVVRNFEQPVQGVLIHGYVPIK